MLSMILGPHGPSGRTIGHLAIIFVCLLRPNLCLAGQSQVDDLTSLKLQVKSLQDQQQQILEQVNELKRLLSTGAPARPAVQRPTTFISHAELSLGDATAPVVLIEYSDFECPYCGGYEREIYPQIFEKYIKTGKVRLFYRDLPLPMHPHAMQAARAAWCAEEQSKYWEMHDSLFAKQNALSDPALLDRAKTLGLDTNMFTDCLSSNKYKDDIQKSIAEAQKLGIGGTPTFFIGTIDATGDVVSISKRINGARPFADFQAALDELLNSKSQQTASGH